VPAPSRAAPEPRAHPPIEGPRLRLRPLTRADLPELRRCSDPEVERFWGRAAADDDELWTEAVAPGCGAVFPFVVEEEGRGVGVMQYPHDCDRPEDEWQAGIDIYLGADGSRDRGVCTEAVRTLLRYLFEVKGVHRVTIDPEVGNARAIRSYEKAGFRFEGVLRHNDRLDGRWVDTHYMAILGDEWPTAREAWLGAGSPSPLTGGAS
jgi:aminoglycoside 6'-N-acetyltransferase